MEQLSFFLEGVVHDKDEMADFEGPLSLILLLLQKNKIEIRDIQISDILDQYLAYLDQMQRLDLELASEFVQMASHLLYIKTKMLLTGEEESSELELLMASLEQLKNRDALEAVKAVVPALKDASELGLLYYPKLPEPLPKRGRVYEYRHEPAELLQALSRVFSRGVKTPETDPIGAAIPRRIVYSVRDKSRQILQSVSRGSVPLRTLYEGCGTRSELVATFLSLLELCSMGGVTIDRAEDGVYTVSYAGGELDELLERIEE